MTLQGRGIDLFADDTGDGLFSAERGGDAEDGDRFYTGVFAKGALDFAGVEFAAADIDEVAGAADEDESLGGFLQEIARDG